MTAQKPFIGLVFLALMSSFSWCFGAEKNIVFYMHDIVSKPNSTVTVVAGVNGTSSNLLGFGTVLVVDDLLTEKPDPSSTVVGRAKGLYSNSDVKSATIFFGLSVVFENKEYSGSTLQIQGTDPFTQSSEKEVAVVGGTGMFRYARGYAIISLQSFSGLDGHIKFNTTFRLG